jgi:hypothetical protein
MKKALMLGAMAFAAFTFAASHNAEAKKYKVGFETASGGAYCDGLDVDVSKTTDEAIGTHVYYQADCPYKNTYVGGFGGSIKALGAGTWYSLTGSQDPGSYPSPLDVLVYYANFKSATWALAIESTYDSISFEVVNSGILGAPLDANAKPKAHLGSLAKASIAKFRAEHNIK